MVPVPNNWTSYFQPLDILVNKPCKDFLRNKAQTWYSDQIVEQTKVGKLPQEIKAGTQLSVVNPLHAKWVTKFYDYCTFDQNQKLFAMVGVNRRLLSI